MRSVRINLDPRVAPGKRIDAVDELKGLAIALIVLYHGEGIVGIPNVLHGEIGVDISYPERIHARQWTRPRCRLAVPPAPLLEDLPGPTGWLSGSLSGCRGGSRGDPKLGGTWQHVVGIHGFSRPAYFSDISEPFWFISMILAAYLVFACIRRRLDDLSLVIAVAGALTLLATILYQDNHHTGGLIELAVRIPSFFAGVIAGRLLCAGTAEIRFNLVLGLGLLCFYYQTFFRSTANNYTLPAIGIIATWLGLRRLLVGILPGAGLPGGILPAGPHFLRGLPFPPAPHPRLQHLLLRPRPQ